MPRMYLISRRDETTHLSDYLASLLGARYGAQNVARGTYARTLADYAQAVERDLRRSDVALVVIGPHWLTNLGASGQPWLLQPDDPTRIALATALRLGMLVAPILSEGAQMPAADALPPDLRRLAQMQALPIRPAPYFASDIQQLYQQINTKLTWRPASVSLILLTIVSGGAFAGVYFTDTTSAASPVFVLAFVGALLATGITALTLAIRRKSKLWLWLLIAAMVTALATYLAPISYLLKDGGMLLLLGALLVFALIGPRRETAFA